MDSGQKKIKSFGPESNLENLVIEMEIVLLSKKSHSLKDVFSHIQSLDLSVCLGGITRGS